ncbi:MAG: glycosyltransferase family 4 protein [Patescibacteria group bacterium]
MKKRILFAVTKGNWGGAQRYVFDLATRLPKDQFEVCVLCGAGEQLEARLKEKNIRVIRLESLNRDVNIAKDAMSFVTLYRIFRKEKPDIVHLNSSKIGAIGALAGRLAGIKKIIFTGHGWAWNEDRFFLSKILIAFIHWLTILLSHTTIAVSEKVKDEISRLPFIPKSKIVVIHNGVANTEYMERFTARGALNSDISEKFWVGTISELHRNKGVDNLVTAFADVAETHLDIALVIIGEGDELERLTALIQKLGLSKKVHLLGRKENAGKFLKAFDVFVLASRTEAFPYVPLEAGLAQLPVVATQVGGIPEAITDGKNGLLVRSGDIPALAGAIKELLNDGAKAAILGHNLRKTVEEKFSVNLMVQKTIAVYN